MHYQLLIILIFWFVIDIVGINISMGQQRVGKFKNACAITVDPKGNIYIVDEGANEVLKYTNNFQLEIKVGGFGWSPYSFDSPRDIVCSDGINVFVADHNNHRIQRFDRNLNFISSLYFRDNDNQAQSFGYPRSIATDRSGSLYVLDGENKRVMKITSAKTIERTWGALEAGKGRLYDPARIRVVSSDNVFVQDGKRIIVFDIFGNYIRTISVSDIDTIVTFTNNINYIFILDGFKIHCISFIGKVLWTYTIPEILDDENRITDIAVFGNNLFLLKKKYFEVLNFHEISLDLDKKD